MVNAPPSAVPEDSSRETVATVNAEWTVVAVVLARNRVGAVAIAAWAVVEAGAWVGTGSETVWVPPSAVAETLRRGVRVGTANVPHP